MKKENNFLWMIWIILKYWTLEKFRTNIRCWFGHKYEETSIPNIHTCKRCGQTTFFMYLTYDDE